jgi:hypothetical protein
MVCRKRPQLPEPGLVLRPRIGRGGPVSQQLGHLGFRRQLVRLTQLHIRRDRLPAKAWILPGPAGAGSDEIAGSRRRGLLDRDRRNETGVAAHHPRRRTVTSCCLSGHRCCAGRNCRLIRWQHIGPHGRGCRGAASSREAVWQPAAIRPARQTSAGRILGLMIVIIPVSTKWWS